MIFHRLFRISLMQIKYLKGVKSLNAIMHVQRRKRTHFTEEQKRELESAFSNGLTSICAKNTEAIEDLAKRLHCSTQVVKVCPLIPRQCIVTDQYGYVRV